MVVFDNYESSSTKDITYIHRTGGKVYPEGKKGHFLSNLKIKQRLNNLIGNELKLKGCNVIHSSKGDADADIVKTTLKASEFIDTILVREDTDLLILLLSQYSPGMHKNKIQFKSDKSNSKCVIYGIPLIHGQLGNENCPVLLPLHAFSGCDTTRIQWMRHHVWNIHRREAKNV